MILGTVSFAGLHKRISEFLGPCKNPMTPGCVYSENLSLDPHDCMATTLSMSLIYINATFKL